MGIDLFQNKIASLLLLFSLISVVALSGCLNSSDRNTQKYTLLVKNLDIVPGQIKTSTIELKVTTYIENRGDASAAIDQQKHLPAFEGHQFRQRLPCQSDHDLYR